MTLLAVPNVSEGRDQDIIAAIAAALGGQRGQSPQSALGGQKGQSPQSAVGGGQKGQSPQSAVVLDVSSDVDHHRTVFTVRGEGLAEAVAAATEVAIARIDLRAHRGAHPRVGAVDVAPIVYLDEAERGAACAEALVMAELIGSLGVPVLLYGALAGGRARADVRRDPTAFASDYGPRAPHPTAGYTLVAARPPLIAFNVEIDATVETARAVAADLRATLPGVRALGLELPEQGIVQVSTNIEEPARAGPADVVAAVARHVTVLAAELVAPAPRSAFAGFPEDVPLKGAHRVFL